MSGVQTTAVFNREQAILDRMRQVRLLAFRAHKRCRPEVDLDDLVSAGTVGLIEAIDRFDPGRNLQLNTFAEHRIRGAILDYLRRLDPMPRAVRHFQRQRDEAEARLEFRLKRQPSETELASELGCTVKHYRKLTLVVHAASLLSLDAPAKDTARPFQVAAPEPGETDDCSAVQRLEAAISGLPPREHVIITALRAGQTLRQAARRLRIHESRASQLKGLAIVRLRLELGLPGGTP